MCRLNAVELSKLLTLRSEIDRFLVIGSQSASSTIYKYLRKYKSSQEGQVYSE